MEPPLPWLFLCRLLGQQVKPHLLSEARVLTQLLWRCSGVMLPPGKAQSCHTVPHTDSREGGGQGQVAGCPHHGSRHPVHPKQGWVTSGCGDTRDANDQA